MRNLPPEYNDRLQCFVHTLTYCFAQQQGLVFLADDNCVDIEGCIKLFTDIDPGVLSIWTKTNGQFDVGCSRVSVDHEWVVAITRPIESE